MCSDRRPPVAGQVAALPQPRVEVVKQRAADLPQFHRSQGGQDCPADVPLIGAPGGNIQLGDLHVPGDCLADGNAGIWPAPRIGLLEQLAQGDLGFPLGPDCLAVPELAAGQRISPGENAHPERPAGQSLYVTRLR